MVNFLDQVSDQRRIIKAETHMIFRRDLLNDLVQDFDSDLHFTRHSMANDQVTRHLSLITGIYAL